MELKRITPENFDKVWELMVASFPPFELRTRNAQSALISHPNFNPYIIDNDGSLAGIIFNWVFDDICYVEHFATLPSLRGQGVGAKALSMLADRYPLTVLEIDPPIDDISRRRQGFYERAGLIVNPYDYRHIGYPPNFTSHELVIMSYPRLITAAEFEAFKEFNYNVVCSF